MAEKIIMAAIRQGELIFAMERPAQHHDIIREIVGHGGEKPVGGEMSFLTSEGRFVDREEAGRIALASGQLKEIPRPPTLYSEDLWSRTDPEGYAERFPRDDPFSD